MDFLAFPFLVDGGIVSVVNLLLKYKLIHTILQVCSFPVRSFQARDDSVDTPM